MPLTRPLAIKSAGGPGASASGVHHVGRTSGRSYSTPVGAVPTDDGFVIALPVHGRSAAVGCRRRARLDGIIVTPPSRSSSVSPSTSSVGRPAASSPWPCSNGSKPGTTRTAGTPPSARSARSPTRPPEPPPPSRRRREPDRLAARTRPDWVQGHRCGISFVCSCRNTPRITPMAPPMVDPRRLPQSPPLQGTPTLFDRSG